MSSESSSANWTSPRGDDSGRDATEKIEMRVDEASNKAKRVIGQAAEQASDTVDRLSGTAKEAYGRTAKNAQWAADAVDPFVKDRPYAALGMAAVAGLVLGLLLTGRGPLNR